MAASRSSLAQINGHELYVETHGPASGPLVVLLHHGLGSVYSWKAQAPALAAAGYHVLAYDRWGYGKSARRSGLSIPFFEEDLQDLEALLAPKQRAQKLRAQKPAQTGPVQAALVGHSDGGTLALYFASRYPQRVSHLVAVAAHIYVEPKMAAGIHGLRQAFQAGEGLRVGLRRLHGDKVEAVFQGWYEGWRRPENLSWDIRPLLGKIACPVLVAQGIEDEHATPQHARDLAAAIPKAAIWLEPGAGHMLPQDRPEEFNRRLLEFLGR